jgi:xylulose-5-phosphate/fructose-6-phosphate phosphoketolase
MPAQLVSQPNPRPDPSLLPDSVLDYAIKLDTTNYLLPYELEAIRQFRRAADYIAAGMLLGLHTSRRANLLTAMIFLNDNVLLDKDLTHDHIKPRLLGHWGTCPGLIMVYAHLNRIIRKTGLDALYVVGPGTSTFIVYHSPPSAGF